MASLPTLPYNEDQAMEELTDQLTFPMPMRVFLRIAAKIRQQEREIRLLRRKVPPWCDPDVTPTTASTTGGNVRMEVEFKKGKDELHCLTSPLDDAGPQDEVEQFSQVVTAGSNLQNMNRQSQTPTAIPSMTAAAVPWLDVSPAGSNRTEVTVEGTTPPTTGPTTQPEFELVATTPTTRAQGAGGTTTGGTLAALS